jgi:hypothetical protein
MNGEQAGGTPDLLVTSSRQAKVYYTIVSGPVEPYRARAKHGREGAVLLRLHLRRGAALFRVAGQRIAHRVNPKDLAGTR